MNLEDIKDWYSHAGLDLAIANLLIYGAAFILLSEGFKVLGLIVILVAVLSDIDFVSREC